MGGPTPATSLMASVLGARGETTFGKGHRGSEARPGVKNSTLPELELPIENTSATPSLRIGDEKPFERTMGNDGGMTFGHEESGSFRGGE